MSVLLRLLDRRVLLALCGCLSSAAAHAQVSAWTGTWKGAAGATMSVVENAGSLDAWGKDEASIYRLSCVVDQKDVRQASCVGEGMNHVRGTRFNYRSMLKLEANGQVSESWEAQEFLGGANGRESFTRVPTRK